MKGNKVCFTIKIPSGVAGRGAERRRGRDNNSDKMVCCMDVEERNVAKSGYKIIDD